jgi:hypothetical protein
MLRLTCASRVVTATVTLAAWLAACAAPETLVQSVDATAIGSATTYSLEPPPAPAASDEGRQLRGAVETELGHSLEAKGFRALPAGADLKVAFRLVPTGRVDRDERAHPRAEARTPVGPGDPYGGYRPLAGADGGERLGMLLVTITDTRSGAIVWQATSEGSATGTASATAAVTRAAHAALEKLPHARATSP